MNYTLHQLQVFHKISQTLSVTKAAEELHLTQPAVSIQLKNFQNQFDIPLTEVIGRKIYITEFGKEVANSAEKIIEQVHAINFKKSSFKGEIIGKLKISIVSTGKYVMPYFLTDFLKQNEGVELNMDVTNKSRVIEQLSNNEVDFALVSVLPEKMNIDFTELLKNKLYVFDSTENNYKKSNYSKSILEELPIIYREEGSGTRYVMEKYIQSNHLSVLKKMELTSNEAVKQAVVAGLGCSIMPIIGLKNEVLNKELQIIPIKGFPIESTWNLIWLKDKNMSNVAKKYLEYLENEKSTIIRDKFNWYDEY